MVAAVVALVATVTPILPASAAADPADLDVSFGDGGTVTITGGSETTFSASDDVLVRPDGRLVVVGRAVSTPMTHVVDPQIYVAQLTPSGAMDESFGQGGIAWISVRGLLEVRAAALQSDGALLVVGSIRGDAELLTDDAVVARFTSTGQPDAAFGDGGYRRVELGDGTVDRGAAIAEAPVTSGEAMTSILVAGTAGHGSAAGRFALRRLDSVDGSDTGPIAYADPSTSSDWVNDMAVLSDGRAVLTGFGANDSRTATARFDSHGALDSSWGTGGIVLTDALVGGGEGARSVVVDETDGTTYVSGYWGGGGTRGMLLRYSSAGTLDPAFGSGGVRTIDFVEGAGVATNAGSVTLDGSGRPVVVGQHGGEGVQLGLARFTATDYDASFGGDGRQVYDCTSGGGSAVAVQPDGRIVSVGTCAGSLRILRVLGGEAGPAVPVVDGVTVALSGAADAGSEVIDPADVDPAALLVGGGADELQSAPVRNTPVRNTPVRNTPVRNTPVRNTPVRNTPLADPALPPVLLSEVRLFSGTWDERLVGTAFEGAPLQTVTLQDLLAITSPDPLAGMTLADIAIEDTPVRNTSYASLLLSGVSLSKLPAPAGGWCDYLTGQPIHCGDGVDLTTTTLLALELNGVDLGPYLAEPLSLDATDLAGSTLGTFLLTDVNLPATPFADAATSEVSSLLTCGTTCPPTLGEAHEEGSVASTATIAELVGLLAIPGGPGDVSLGELLRGLFGPDELPFADVPLPAILEAAQVRSDRLTRVELEFDLDCTQTTGFVAEVETAPGVRYAGSDFLQADAVMEHVNETWKPVGDGTFRLSEPTICQDIPAGGVRHFTARFDVEPFAALEVLTASATVRSVATETTDGASASAETSSPLPVVDGQDRLAGEAGDARTVTPGMLYTGYVAAPGDIDDFTFAAPAAGSLVTVTASHLPADYDIVLYGPEEGIETAPVRNTPVRNTPVRNTGLGDAAGESGSDANLLPPEGLQDIPVRNTPVRNTSINRGTATESATTLVHDGDEGEPFTIQVSGYDGAWSGEPYVLQVRVTPGPEPLECAARSYTGSGTTGSLHRPAGLADEDVESLIVVNRRRLGEVYGGDPTALMTQLEAFAARPEVNGVVVPVDADAAVTKAYGTWDGDPCSVEAANDVVTAINTHVDAVRDGMPNLRHLVIVGNDELIPMGRVPDRTTIGNQASYTRDVAFDGQDNATSRAFGRRFVLSDDPYADLDPVSWLAGGKLYVPDLALGRLVETPDEIQAALTQFTTNDGELDPGTAFTAGYEFLTDGAEEVESALAGRVGDANSSSEINELWTSTHALDGLSGDDRFASVNAHYDHYEGLPAEAFNTGGPDLFDTGGLQGATVERSILFTMGCHSGLNVPDVYVTGPSEEQAASLDDWPQALTSRGGLYTGNTGYGYGDTEVVGYSEQLMAYNAANLASGTMTAGQALMFAKQQHFGELGLPGVYDAKAMQEATFYGLPMYRIGSTGSVAPPILPQPPVATTGTEDTPFELTPQTQEVEGPRGSYWAVVEDGELRDPQVSHLRPIQPKTSLEVTGSLPVHGVVIEELASDDVPGRTDPVYSEPTIDLGANQHERTPTEAVFPAGITRLSNYATPSGFRDDLVLVTGQFISDPDARDGTGTQRLFTRIAGQVLRSGSSDWQPPTIAAFDAFTTGSAASFVATTPDEDVVRGVVLYRDDVSDVWRKVELESDGTGRMVGTALMGNGGTRVTEAFVQLVDDARNVGTFTRKAEYEESTPLPEPTGMELVLTPALPTSGYFSQVPTVGIEGADGASFEYRLNDGGWLPADGTSIALPSDLPDGVHRVEVRGDDGSSGTVLIPLDQQAPEITIVTPTDGGVYETGDRVTADFHCADAASGVASCEGTVADGEEIDTAAGTHTFTVTAVDHSGHRTTRSVTYHADASFEGFLAPVVGDGETETYNQVKAGRVVPVKFRIWRGDGQVRDPQAVTVTTSPPFACPGASTSATIDETVTGKGAGELRYDAETEQFIYTYPTSKSWGAQEYCTTLTVRYGETMVKTAHFRFVR